MRAFSEFETEWNLGLKMCFFYGGGGGERFWLRIFWGVGLKPRVVIFMLRKGTFLSYVVDCQNSWCKNTPV